MSVLSLASTLQAAGAVRAMELDINTDWVSAFTYVPQDPTTLDSPIVGLKLLDNMSHDGEPLPPAERARLLRLHSPTPRSSVPTTTTTTPTTTTTTRK